MLEYSKQGISGTKSSFYHNTHDVTFSRKIFHRRAGSADFFTFLSKPFRMGDKIPLKRNHITLQKGCRKPFGLQQPLVQLPFRK